MTPASALRCAGAILLADPAASKTLLERCANHVPLVWIASAPGLASTVKVEQVWVDDQGDRHCRTDLFDDGQRT